MVTTGYFRHYAPKTFVTLNLTSNDIGQELVVVFQDGALVSSQDVSNAKIYLSFIYFSLHDDGVLDWVMVVGLSLSDGPPSFLSCKMLALDDLNF